MNPEDSMADYVGRLERDRAALLAACKLGKARLDRKAETCRNDAWKVDDQAAWEALNAAITQSEAN